MVVIEELAAELKIELATELVDATTNLLGLQFDVLLVIETLTHVPMLLPTAAL